MSRYLLDTGPLATYLLGRSAAVALIRPLLRHDEAVTSPLVYAEVTEYLLSLAQPALRQRGLRLLLCDVKFRHLRCPRSNATPHCVGSFARLAVQV